MHPNQIRAALLVIPVLLFTFGALAKDKKHAIPIKDSKGATTFKVLRTIDGDTIEIEKGGKPVKVRLTAVGTPETVHPSKPVGAFEREASLFTFNLLKCESSTSNSTRTRPTSMVGCSRSCTARRTACS